MLALDGELPSDRFVVPPPPSPPGLRGRSAPACRRAPITGGRYRKSTLTENAPYKSKSRPDAISVGSVGSVIKHRRPVASMEYQTTRAKAFRNNMVACNLNNHIRAMRSA